MESGVPRSGPLGGLKVLEMAGAGSVSHAAMTLADLGAEVVRLERPADGSPRMGGPEDPVFRGRRRVVADLRAASGRETALALVAHADVSLEALRPGVAERLGIGPDDCLARNARLVYARLSGFGRQGPLAPRAGHDINYLALTGALRAMGRAAGPPAPPLNLLGFGGGGMYVVTGVLAALWEVSRSGVGQVVDAAILDGVTHLSTMIWAMRHRGEWTDRRQSNLTDGGAPFYDTYACADGEFVAVGAVEPQFYAQLVEGLGLAGADLPAQHDVAAWPLLRGRLAAVIATRTRDEWTAHFAERDACLTPVLSYAEAADHPQVGGRGSLVSPAGITQSVPQPCFSRTPAALPGPERDPEDVGAVLADWAGADR
ncbi:MAG: Alpha-methylacyl-CoA racemase (2-methylacyl-CoA racemase) [Frankiales bacterium]|nr:Alpha-methylacyl-CoA racemase (2-methylacyl-CoA racemase) [Frankiales bacterium]